MHVCPYDDVLCSFVFMNNLLGLSCLILKGAKLEECYLETNVRVYQSLNYPQKLPWPTEGVKIGNKISHAPTHRKLAVCYCPAYSKLFTPNSRGAKLRKGE